jgi:hypothetical protein
MFSLQSEIFIKMFQAKLGWQSFILGESHPWTCGKNSHFLFQGGEVVVVVARTSSLKVL